MTGCHHCEAPIIGRLQHIIELLFAFDSCMVKALGWRAHNMIGSEAREATFGSRVRAMELCPSLLEQTNP